MEKRVIGILGSPLEEGNTALLLDSALQGAVKAGCSVEKIIVSQMQISGCMEMMHCKDHPICEVDDDMIPVYGKIRDCDGLIIATPIMTMGIPGELKCFMDRFQVFFMAKYVRRQPLVSAEREKQRQGLFIAISGMNRKDVFSGALLSVAAFFDIIGMKFADRLLINDMDQKRNLRNYPDLVNEAYTKGETLGRLLFSTP
jgi:putative NADPH-quinone reductase